MQVLRQNNYIHGSPGQKSNIIPLCISLALLRSKRSSVKLMGGAHTHWVNMNTYHVYTACMSSTLNRRSTLECFECSNASEIHNGISTQYCHILISECWLHAGATVCTSNEAESFPTIQAHRQSSHKEQHMSASFPVSTEEGKPSPFYHVNDVIQYHFLHRNYKFGITCR